MSDTKLPQLSGVELTYKLLKSQEVGLIGEPQGPFAIASSPLQKIFVFGGDETNVRHISFEDDEALYPLGLAQKLGASFSVEGTTVTCRIGEIVALGDNYSEAAMRGLIAYRIVSGQKA